MSSDNYGSPKTRESSPLLRNDQSNSVSQNSMSNRKSPWKNQAYDSISEQTTTQNFERIPTSTNRTRNDSDSSKERSYSQTSNADESETDSSSNTPVRGFSFFALPRRQKLILISICMADFLSYLSLSLLAPFFPKEVSIVTLVPPKNKAGDI